jgi:hypothetical protein
MLDSRVTPASFSSRGREIGLDAAQHPELMWIAEDYFLAQLPDGWIEHPDAASGKLYYFNPTLNRSQWQHPLEGYFRGLVYMVRLNKPCHKPIKQVRGFKERFE